jgi:2-polyprenyl-3-methyl-5-hydroxy-6-metoxy-1,4-benzoquinol methylase
MPIPRHTDSGTLPKGTHIASLDEVEARFGTNNPQRENMMRSLKTVYDECGLAGMNRLILGGSFITTKPMPRDLDGIIFGGENADWERILPFVQVPGERRTSWLNLQIAFKVDSLSMLQDFYTRDRLGKHRGVVEVPILTAPSSKVLLNPDIDTDLLNIQIEQALSIYKQTRDGIIKEALEKLIAELKLRKLSTSTTDFYAECLRTEVSMEGNTGIGDLQINSLLGLFLRHEGELTIVDYGCGKGRLASEIATLDSSLLSRTTYVAIDFNTSKAKLTAIDFKLDTRCKELIFLTYDQAREINKIGDFVIMINVLHEVNLREISSVLSKALELIKPGGYLIIHDMEHISAGEPSFVPWKGEETVKLLHGIDADIGLRKHQSRKGIPLYTVHAHMHSGYLFKGDCLLKRAIEIYHFKEQQFLKKRLELIKSPSNSRLYAYYSVAIANIREQLFEVGDIRESTENGI